MTFREHAGTGNTYGRINCDTEGNLVSVEILDASTRVSEAQKVEFQTVE